MPPSTVVTDASRVILQLIFIGKAMSPSVIHNGSNGTFKGTANGHFTNDLNLSILGLGVEYPPYRVGPEAVQTLAERFYPPSPA